MSNGFRLVDPSLARARSVAAPFGWSSVPAPMTRVRQVSRILEAASDLGLTDGFFCPHHMRDTENRLRSHVCALLWADDPESFRRNLAENRPALHFITTHFTERAVTLRGLRSWTFPETERQEQDITAREREVLELAARGRTSPEIAALLQISALTAQTHMKNAIRKMHASNRTHAVSLAIARGLVRP